MKDAAEAFIICTFLVCATVIIVLCGMGKLTAFIH
jgi:hypothetical protein